MKAPPKTTFELLLTTERHRRRTNESTMAGFAVPALAERPLSVTQEPLVVTNARGEFVPTHVSRTRGMARYGYFECLSSEEGPLVPRFFSALWGMSQTNGWDNRCTSLEEAASKMKLEPHSVVVPYDLVEKISSLTREEVDQIMCAQGYISKGEQRIIAADLPEGQAMLLAIPALVGVYTRIDDRLGLMFMQVNQTVFLVRGAAS